MPKNYPTPLNEEKRLASLYDYDILDTVFEETYDNITRIASQICNTPASLITLLDRDRQWFKSNYGVAITETPREISFCNYTILDPENILVIPDMRRDARYANNPLVTGEPHAVFYAGAPLVTPDGYVLGSICVLDAKENHLTPEQSKALHALAQEVIARMELQKKIKELNISRQKLSDANGQLKKFAAMISHDIKTPLANISLVNGAFKLQYKEVFDENANSYLDIIDKSAKEIMLFVNDILAQAENAGNRNDAEEQVNSRTVINKVIDMVAPPDDFEIQVHGSFPALQINKVSLQQVFQNLITNAIKYNNKEKGIIHITSKSDGNYNYFCVSDNGSGIDNECLHSIFTYRQTLRKTDRYGNQGTGIGLAAVKSIIESNGGNIAVNSQKGIGTAFEFSLPLTTLKAS